MRRPFLFLVGGAANEDRLGNGAEPPAVDPVVYVLRKEDFVEVWPHDEPPPPPAEAPEEADHE